MVIARGYLSKAGLKKGTTWGTAVDTNVAGQGLPFLNESISSASNLLTNETLTGTRDRNAGVTSSITFAGAIESILEYNSPTLMTLIAMCMGRADTPASPNGIPTAKKPYPYYASYRLGTTLEGYFATLAFDKQQDGSTIHEYDSIKVNGMTISGAAGDWVKISVDIIARKLSTSGTTTTSLGSATVTVPNKYIRFEELEFRIADASGGALAVTDQIYPSSFSLTVANSLVGDLTSLNAPYVDEPIVDNAVEITGTFEIPKLTGSTIETDFLAGTEKKMSIRARSTDQIIAAGGGPYYYEFSMYFPNVQITDAQRAISGFSKIMAPFSWTANRATSAPDGMDGNGNLSTLTSDESRGSLTSAMEIEVTNLLKTNPLA